MEREQAPGQLALVERFVNSIDGDRDDIATPEGLRTWLAEAGYADEPTSADVERLHEIREGLRSVLDANSGDPVDPAAVAGLNRALAATTMRVRVAEDGSAELVAEGGIERLVADLAAAMMAARADGTWARLKVCRDDTCRWAFYDRSKNRSGTWCSMEDCGSKAKMRAYRERRARAAG